jgi:hypothetical protein
VNPTTVWGQLWEPFIKPALGFQTSKQVRLNDWRLGICLRVAQLMVVAYTIYDVVRPSPFAVALGWCMPNADRRSLEGLLVG